MRCTCTVQSADTLNPDLDGESRDWMVSHHFFSVQPSWWWMKFEKAVGKSSVKKRALVMTSRVPGYAPSSRVVSVSSRPTLMQSHPDSRTHPVAVAWCAPSLSSGKSCKPWQVWGLFFEYFPNELGPNSKKFPKILGKFLILFLKWEEEFFES